MDKETRNKSSAEILRAILENSSTVICFGLHLIQFNCVYSYVCFVLLKINQKSHQMCSLKCFFS